MFLIDRKATNESTLLQLAANWKKEFTPTLLWIMAHKTNWRMSLTKGLHLHVSKSKKEKNVVSKLILPKPTVLFPYSQCIATISSWALKRNMATSVRHLLKTWILTSNNSVIKSPFHALNCLFSRWSPDNKLQ